MKTACDFSFHATLVPIIASQPNVHGPLCFPVGLHLLKYSFGSFGWGRTWFALGAFLFFSGYALGQGTLTNGIAHDGVISTAGEMDTFTLPANVGDRIVVQVAELSGGAAFTPRIDLYGPDGFRVGSHSGPSVARLDIQAHVTGSFAVVVSDLNQSGMGTYRLRVGQVPGGLTVPAGGDGGALTNGANYQGTIEVGDLDLWTVTANPEDRIIVQLAEVTGGAAFTPLVELLTPDGRRLAGNSGGVATRVEAQAALGGTYTVMVSDLNQTGSGTYRLRLAQVPAAFVVPMSDEGGALTNGANQSGTIDSGDIDLWTFTASQGDRIALQVNEVSGAAGFTPVLELFSPNGSRLAVDSDGLVARVDAQASLSGTYTVAVSDLSTSGNGTYQLHLAKAPGDFVVPQGDEGGALMDAVPQDAAIGVGDFDLWTFAATTGERITVLLTELTGGANFTPRIELFNADGHRQATAQGATAGTLEAAIEMGGTYTLLVSDANQVGAGTYRLSMSRSSVGPGSANVLTNGLAHLGNIAVAGQTNTWSFTATAGESLVLHLGETAAGPFVPALRLTGPNGALLAASAGSAAAEVSVRTTNSGTFTVSVADGSVGRNQTSSYRLTLAKTGSALMIALGDEGGPLANGASYLSAIVTGDADAWTFGANAGESISVWMGETMAGSTLYPWLRLYGPDGVLLANDFNPGAADVTVRTTNSGTFLVVIADGNSGRDGTGNYRLSLVKTGGGLMTSPGEDGGTLTNAASYAATIENGDVHGWTFTANAGETLAVWMGETIEASSLYPWLRLFGPDGVQLADDFNPAAAEVTFRATNSGTFTVMTSDGNSGRTGMGTYRLSLAKTGSPLQLSLSDEGGALVNGTTYTGTIEVGDVDQWTFIANAGENIVARVGETASTTLYPWLRLFSPNGVLLSQDFNPAAAEVSFRATNSGTFTLFFGDGNSGRAGLGDYRLSLAKSGGPLAISPTDEGGSLVNGTTYLAAIENGDLDAWSFNAAAGENILVRMGEVMAASGLYPWLRLYGPNGVSLSSDFNHAAAEVAFRATNTGTFLVVVGDGNSGLGGIGDYRLSLAKTGSPLTISPSDDGGPLTNGTTYLAGISTGDLDAWSFSASAGETIVVRMGETTVASGLYPWLRLYGPNGALLSDDFNPAAAEVIFRATNNGIFQVVAADGNSGLGGLGDYRLTLAKTSDPIVVSSGDEGGSFTGSGTYDGNIDVGDVDLWSFTACAGDILSLHIAELVTASGLYPWMRLYGRDGVLLNSVSGPVSAQINRAAPVSGVYTVMIGDGNSGIGGSGSYRLTVNGLTAGLKLCIPLVLGTNINLRGIGGVPHAPFIVFTHTNVATPRTNWTPWFTNQFDPFGVFSRTNSLNRAEHQRYFLLVPQ